MINAWWQDSGLVGVDEFTFEERCVARAGCEGIVKLPMKFRCSAGMIRAPKAHAVSPNTTIICRGLHGMNVFVFLMLVSR
jgi:hypothetical protein